MWVVAPRSGVRAGRSGIGGVHPDRTVRAGVPSIRVFTEVTGLRHRLATFAIIEYQARRRRLLIKRLSRRDIPTLARSLLIQGFRKAT
jgi:hypothetical protein